MRVAVFLRTFPAVSETFILRQITGLVDRGHEVDIFAERRPENGNPIHGEVARYGLLARTMYLNDQIPPETGYWEMPVWPPTGKTWIPGEEMPRANLSRLAKALPTFVRCLARAPRTTLRVVNPSDYGAQARSLLALYQLAALYPRQPRYDVIHAHYGSTGNSFRYLRHLWGAPLVVSFHGWDFSKAPRDSGRDLYSKLFRDADAVTAVSEYAAKVLRGLSCPAKRLHTLHCGLSAAEFPFRPRHPVPHKPVRLLTVARLVEKKGIEFALRAVRAVRSHGANVRYDIIGDGPQRAALDALVRELGLESDVTMHGARSGEFVRERMTSAHLFVLPSVTGADGDQEGIPVSLMEAQACGLPVLSTWHSGIPELVADGRSGFLVPERDADALAERLLHLIEHPQTWPDMGRAGRSIVEAQFDIRALNHQLVRIYEHATREFQRRQRASMAAR